MNAKLLLVPVVVAAAGCASGGEIPRSAAKTAIAGGLPDWVRANGGAWAEIAVEPGESGSWTFVERNGFVKPADRDALRKAIEARVEDAIAKNGKIGNSGMGQDDAPSAFDYESSGLHGGGFVWVTGDASGRTIVSVSLHESR